MGADSNYEANSKKTFLTILLKYFTYKLILGHVSRLQTEPENSKLIAERKYGEGMEKNSIEGLVLDFGMLNGYGVKVNGPLIHANQLAFG